MKLDTDHGVTEYEVEFVSGNTEYDYDIDAVTGAIRSFDFETHNGHSASSSASGENAALPAGSISEADAKKLVEATHQVCPYSNALRGNVDVRLHITTA